MRALLSLVVVTTLAFTACAGSSAGDSKGKAPAKAPAKTVKPKAAVKSASAEKTPEAPAAGDDPSADAYTYQVAGRRDPFQNLLGAGSAPSVVSRKGEGAASVGVGEITVRAVIRTGTMAIANIQGPDGKNYYVRAGDKLMDGTVKSVTAQGLVVVQEVNDPLSVEKQREVRKLLRSQEDAKQ